MKIFDLSFIGSGVGSSEVIFNLIKSISLEKNSLKKKAYNILLIDRHKENIGGGIPYTKEFCKYGYFNNPCRLSPKKFVNWSLSKKNMNKIFDYLEEEGGISGKNWVKKNSILKKNLNRKNLSEIYLPRAALGFWLKDNYNATFKLLKLLEKKIKIYLYFVKGEPSKIKRKNNKYEIFFKKNSRIEKLEFKAADFIFKTINIKKISKITSKKIIISTGVPKAKKLTNLTKKEYIDDLYLRKGSAEILNLINTFQKKNITIHILGSKAGFLESLTELSSSYRFLKKKIKIICSSTDSTTLNPAVFSGKTLKLKYFTSFKINKILKAQEIYILIKKELSRSKNNKIRYNLWTQILKNKLLNKALIKLDKNELDIYNLYFFQKIRSLTRFTYPEAVYAMRKLKKMGILKIKKEKVVKIKLIKKNLYTTCAKLDKKNYTRKSDIVVNVMGPTKFNHLVKNNSFLKSIVDTGAEFNNSGFICDNNFETKNLKGFFIINSLASGFNKERKTILNATIKNAQISAREIFNQINH